MSVTRQEPAKDGDRGRGRIAPQDMGAGRQAGQGTRPAIPFDMFLMAMYPGAVDKGDTEWLEWYEGWLAGMPEDGREAYLERSKAEYERRIGMSIDERMDLMLDEIAAKNRAESLAERAAKNRAESLAERAAKNRAEILAEITKSNIEEATNHQIMVENFRVFGREYFGMMARRSC